MHRRWTWAGGLLLGLAGLWLATECAQGVIIKLTPLSEILNDQDFISVATVEKFQPEKPAMVLAVTEDLKGKMPVRRLPVVIKGDSEAEKLGHTPQLLKRLAVDLPLILFTNQRGKRLTVFAYTNGTWFQMVGQRDGERATLAFTHCEPYLRRTFKGTTAEMKQVLIDGLSKKKAPPPPNEKEPPGLGPEVGGKDKETRRQGGRETRGQGGKETENQGKGPFVSAPRTPQGRHAEVVSLSPCLPVSLSPCLLGLFSHFTPFAVIPTLGVGGPLAILALLFPSLFGGVLLLFRQWLAFFTVLTINSLVLLLHWWLADPLRGGWWSSQTALWLMLTAVYLGGALWAWRRQLRGFEPGQVRPEAPRRTELLVLLLLSVCCAVPALMFYFWPPPALDGLWLLTFATSAGVWLATAQRLYRAFRPTLVSALDMPSEGLILWGGLALAVVLVAGQHQVSSAPEVTTTADGRPAAKLLECWGIPLDMQARGMVVSGVRVDGDRLYVAVAHSKGAEKFGTVYCLNRFTREILWTFDDDGDMKQVFSSPHIADGRLYIGEGFHDDPACKLYCIDVVNIDRATKQARKLWHFPTQSQTEASPTVARGKVFFGAGNEGVYALPVNISKADAEKGRYAWRYPPDPGQGPIWRIGASPTVAGNRLYVGSGVDRNHPNDPTETSVVCLEADTGKEIWKVPTSLPCWAPAVVAGKQVFFALGNGDVFTDDPKKPAGMILCLEADTGKEQWRFVVPNAVLEKPAVDGQRLYFGCRDGKCYCLGRFDGQLRWEKAIGSPVVAAVALDQGEGNGISQNVFVIGTGGQVQCLDSYTGKVIWSYTELMGHAPHLLSPPVVTLSPEPSGLRRRLYFGVALQNLTFPAVYCAEDLVSEK